MPKNKKIFSSEKEITIKPSKSNTFNDGVKNAANQQNLDNELNMPRGAKKPEKTAK